MSTFATYPEFWASAILAQLYSKSPMINLVHRDFSQMVAEKGEIVHATLPEKSVMQDVSTTVASSVDASPTTIPVTLDKWRETKPIKFTDKMNSMSQVDLVQLYANPMAQAIVVDVESALIAAADTFTHSGGTALPTTLKGFAGFKTEFDTLLVPDGSRSVVLSPAAELEFNNVFGVYNVGGQTGEAQQITGLLGTKFGMGFYGSQIVPVLDAALAFDRDAIALVSRPLAISPGAPVGSQAVINYKGVGLRVVIAYDGRLKCTFISADLLYGVKVLDDRRGFKVRLA